MLTLPQTTATVIDAFAPMFSKRLFAHAKLLLIGAILAPGKRTVTSVLQVMGRSHDQHFQNYHRVLNRARWSTLRGGRILLRLLLRIFAPTGPIVIGIDETIERRRGERMAAKGIYRDPVRSSQAHFVKSQWLALGMPDAPGTCPVDHSYLGVAIPDGAVTLGTLLSAPRPCPPNAVGPRTASCVAGATLAAYKGDDRGG